MKLDLSGMRVTVMGLGVHGGGLSAVRYAVERGATVTVTDLRDEHLLRESVEHLPSSCRLVLGRHDEADFRNADLVIKNPAVPRTAASLSAAPAVTTDIALFLAEWLGDRHGSNGDERIAAGDGRSASDTVPPPLVAITGTKGKSTTSSAAAHIIGTHHPQTRLGGNITISPLDFVGEIGPDVPVVLELSSFQLGDLAFCRRHNDRSSSHLPASLPRSVLHPVVPAAVAVITNIFEDHQDYYASMERYVDDKREIYRHLPDGAICILSARNGWTPSFIADLARNHPSVRVITVDPGNDDSGHDNASGRYVLPDRLPLPGIHNRINLAIAVEAAFHVGVPPETVTAGVASFPGVPHRMEAVRTIATVRFVNDTAATIPEAAEAAVVAYATDQPGTVVHLIAGGSDKGLDPAPLVRAIEAAVRTGGHVALLAGTATERIAEGCTDKGVTGWFIADSLQEAVTRLMEGTRDAGDTTGAGHVILLSPGCASFGMFRNEFDRGRRFIEIVRELPEIAIPG